MGKGKGIKVKKINIMIKFFVSKVILFKTIMSWNMETTEFVKKALNLLIDNKEILESVEKSVSAVKQIDEYERIGFTKDIIVNYKIFEDEIISNGFTIKQIIELMKEQKRSDKQEINITCDKKYIDIMEIACDEMCKHSNLDKESLDEKCDDCPLAKKVNELYQLEKI